MRKFLTIGGVALIATALLLNGVPASATDLKWEDAVGDATPDGEGAVPVSEPGFDVTTVQMSSTATTLQWEASVPGLTAEPPLHGTGMQFTFAFELGENSYSFKISEDRIAGAAQAFYYHSDLLEPQVCDKCRLKIDREAKKVTVDAPIPSIGRAVRSAGVGNKYDVGTKMENVRVEAGPVYFIGAPGVVSLTSFSTYDVAAAAAPGAFIV